jgi:hypothetical protein
MCFTGAFPQVADDQKTAAISAATIPKNLHDGLSGSFASRFLPIRSWCPIVHRGQN